LFGTALIGLLAYTWRKRERNRGEKGDKSNY
jgi:hypothetical protein